MYRVTAMRGLGVRFDQIALSLIDATRLAERLALNEWVATVLPM